LQTAYHKPSAIIILTALLFAAGSAGAQNLFPNPDFEQYISCPDKVSQHDRCAGWNGWAHNTPDYYNCGYYEQYFTGYPYATPYSGTGVMGFVNVSNDHFGTYTEGIIGRLVHTLKAGHHYQLQFHLAIASQGIAGLPAFHDELGFGFYFYNGNSRPQWTASSSHPFDRTCNAFTPQVGVMTSAIDTYDRYKGFTFCFTPAEDYDSVYIGGVCTPLTATLPSQTYYFNLDNISLREQPDTPLLASVTADSICAHTCITLSSSDTARFDSLDFDAPGAFYDKALRLPVLLCYDSAGHFPLSLTLHRAGSCAAFTWQDQVVVTDPVDPHLPDTTLCPRQTLIVDLRGYVLSSLLWNDGDTARLRTFRSPGRYSVSLQAAGCNSSAAFTLYMRDYCTDEVSVPSAFSPNGDGRNDVFHVITNYPLDNFSMRVYNRWGQCVFYDTHYQAGWDGSRADVGTYFYRIAYQRPFTQEMVELKGDVALVR
jgi:gliding motility-associated-like protein